MRESIHSLLFAFLLTVLAGSASLLFACRLLFLLVIVIIVVVILIVLFIIIVLDYSEVVFKSKGNDVVLEY